MNLKFRWQRRMLEFLRAIGAKQCIAQDAGWIRIREYGLHWTRNPPLFSERNGYTKRVRIPFTRWRVGILKPGNNRWNK